MRYLNHWLTLLLLSVAMPTLAQAQCATDILLAINRAGTGCADTERNEACYGIGTIDALLRAEMDELSFAQPGDRVPIDQLEQISTISDDQFSLLRLHLQSDIASTQPGRNVTLLAFGNTTLLNEVPPLPSVRVTTTGTLNIRTAPSIEADIVQEAGLRTSLTANGISEDGEWLRVEIPNSVDVGWISESIVDSSESLDVLRVVTVETPYLRPFQVFRAQTGRDDALCDGTPESGLLLQSPSEEERVSVTVNGAQIELAGTAFIQAIANEAMQIWLLDGQARVEAQGSEVNLVAGANTQLRLENLQVTAIPDAATPYNFESVAALPLNGLGYRMRASQPISETALAAQVAALLAEPTATPEPVPFEDRRCRYTTTQRVVLYAGPGTFYEVIREVARDDRVWPVLKLVDSAGTTWWQVREGHWMLADGAESSGECTEIPITDVVRPPSHNYLSIESCESSNGPIRAGQHVTIDFVDGGWETLADAWNAPRIDPGRIFVNQDRFYVHAGPPVQTGPERFFRTFGTSWRAEPGTYRIVGERLTYRIICNITVPTG